MFLFIINLLISFILIADTIYFKYYKDFLSLGLISSSSLLGGVTSSLKQLIHISDFIYLLDMFTFAPVIRFCRKGILRSIPLRRSFAMFAIFLFLGIGIDSLGIYKLSEDQPRLITSMYNKVYIGKILGALNFHILDGYNFISSSINRGTVSVERVNEIRNFLQSNSVDKGSNLSGVGKGKNLIMIQVEALQQFPINAFVDGKEVTPNLNRWIDKSLYFDNYFYQVAAGNTSDAEFMSNNSLYPAESGASYYRYVGDTLNSLPKTLKDKGYYTAALHGYTEGFWNRATMYKTEDFDDFFGESSFNINETVGMGLSDKSFLSQSIDKLKSFKKPYYSFLITLSSHYPYNDAAGYGDFNVGKYEGTLLGNYLKGIHYTDAQLGMFLDELEKDGIANDSIIVLYGDHNAIPISDMNELYDFVGISNPSDFQWYQYQKVPMMIHFPGDAYKGINHIYSGQVDLYPTLVNIFNFSNDYMLGKDILNTDNQDVLFRNGSFTDGEIFYIAATNTYYNISTGEPITETPQLSEKKLEVQQKLSYSDDILNHNLIKQFETLKSEPTTPLS